MGLEPWYLDMWLFVGIFMTGFAALFAFIGFIMVAVEGRKGWPPKLNAVIVMFITLGWLWPIALVIAIPTSIYRAVRNK
jgi:hypothetical protein